MSDAPQVTLAYDRMGRRFAPHPRAAGWRVLSATGNRGAQPPIFDPESGLPLYVALDCDMETLREAVLAATDGKGARCQLVQVDAAGADIEDADAEAPDAFVLVKGAPAPPPAVPERPNIEKELLQALQAQQKILLDTNAELRKSVAEKDKLLSEIVGKFFRDPPPAAPAAPIEAPQLSEKEQALVGHFLTLFGPTLAKVGEMGGQWLASKVASDMAARAAVATGAP